MQKGIAKDRQKLVRWAQSTPLPVFISIRDVKRSDEQNAHMWAICDAFARQHELMGKRYPRESWKAIFMDAVGLEPEVLPKLDGSGFFVPGHRSSHMGVKAMAEMLEMMISEAAQREVKFHWDKGAA